MEVNGAINKRSNTESRHIFMGIKQVDMKQHEFFPTKATTILNLIWPSVKFAIYLLGFVLKICNL